jgi:predicted nucleic acid-binding protein
MEIVLDTNVIISSLLRNGITRKILFLSPFEFYTPSSTRSEIEKHKEELIRKSKLDADAFQYMMETIFSKIQIVNLHSIEPYKNKSIEIMTGIDVSDAPFIALALHLDCPVWSNDGHFKCSKLLKPIQQKKSENCYRNQVGSKYHDPERSSKTHNQHPLQRARLPLAHRKRRATGTGRRAQGSLLLLPPAAAPDIRISG